MHNPKQFWKSMNKILNKSNKNTTTQIRYNNNIIQEPSVAANIFNQHFASIGNSPVFDSPVAYDSLNSSTCRSSFSLQKILPVEVQHAINKLKDDCGTGPDGIETKFIKLAAHILMYPLCDLFNLSIATCTLPSTWKFAIVTPLHKGGDPRDTNNYRPISIINSLAKILEKLIFNQLSHYVNIFNILSPCQSGFRPNFSTSTALLKFTNNVFSTSENGKLTGAIFLDLTKAFDIVDHYLLLDKLNSIGVTRNTLLWFNSYLHNKRQCVSFNGNLSNYLTVEKGVPQGSSLGPLLFSIFINDLPKICSDCQIYLYADDIVIYTANANRSSIETSIQSEFALVQNWFTTNKLSLNKNKSCCMLLGTRQGLGETPDLTISFNDGSSLERVSSFKYL
uniref:Reverse transcriptase domain-containing protein n=1 Tax=Labrus bergylta TaxID=56723 RepID=A0A3Q3ERT6_9LABR